MVTEKSVQGYNLNYLKPGNKYKGTDISTVATSFEEIINKSPMIVFFWEGEQRVRTNYVSERVTIFGYRPEDFLEGRMTYNELIHPEDRSFVNNEFESFRKNSSNQFTCEYRVVDSSGSIKWISEITFPCKCDDNLEYHGILLDVTDRKMSERTILEKERDISILYSASALASESLDVDDLLDEMLMEMGDLLDITAGGVYIINPEEKEAVLRAYIGPEREYPESIHYSAVENMFDNSAGSPSSPLVAEDTFHYQGQMQRKKYLLFRLYSREKIMGFIQLSIPLNHEVSEKSLQVLEHVGKHIGIAIENAQLFEITQRAYEDLKNLDKLKSEFLANLTHELKTPLISIKGFSDLLDKGRLGELNEDQKKANLAVVRNADRLKRLIDSLLYMSMEKEGKYQYHFEEVDVGEIIKDAMDKMKVHTEGKDVDIGIDLQSKLSPICGDRERLTNVFLNILDNASKFTQGSGRIKITLKEEEEYIHIKIKDNGIGIPKEKLPRIYDMFYQIDGSTTRIYNGVGLGLHICKKVIDIHNGSIWARSMEGLGTTVHVKLPKT
ncbi:PAS domain S-box protein [Methanohalophilus sp. RSK]|uniref:sensor histidine kinase n=1 Tax=Methanohalophilus sp. RSK TaxID=2485783 RepID=UPI000F43CA5C|nr:ATP-binding protein [Methanohalophilus sp. RSK]RNI14421.1 PAS domain S-box protein [Methanohalophilus sp. RSK]